MPRTGGKMTKLQFISYLSETNGISLKDARAAYEIVTKGIERAVIEHGAVRLDGFGVFESKDHKGHPTRLPGGTKDHVADYKVMKFTACEAIRRRLNQKGQE